MGEIKKQANKQPPRKLRPAETVEGRESQLCALATDLAEERLRNGTASSQEIVHFLRLSTVKSKTEQEILELQKDLIAAKTEALKSQKQMEELYTKALRAMSQYSGNISQEDTEDYD